MRVCPVPLAATGLICATAGHRVLAGAGAQCFLCASLPGPYVRMNHNFGPVSSVLSPPGLSVPDGLGSGGRLVLTQGGRFGLEFFYFPILGGIVNSGQCCAGPDVSHSSCDSHKP